MLRSTNIVQLQQSPQGLHGITTSTHSKSPRADAYFINASERLPGKEKEFLETPELKAAPKKLLPSEIKEVEQESPYSPQTPLSRSEYLSPLTRPHLQFHQKSNKCTITTPSLKTEKFDPNGSFQYPPISPTSDASRFIEASPNEIQLSMQLMETYRPTLIQLFEDLLNLNSSEPYFLTRLFSLLPYFSNHYTRQRLLLNLESLIQTNHETISFAPNVSEPISRSSSVRPTYVQSDIQADESTKHAIEEVIKGVLEESDEIKDEHIDMIITIMHKLMSKRFTDTSSQQTYNNKIQTHLRLYRNTKKSAHIIECMADILTNICFGCIVQSNMRPHLEDVDDWSSDAILKPYEFTKISHELEELQNQQKKLSEQLQRFEVERQALQTLHDNMDVNEPEENELFKEDDTSLNVNPDEDEDKEDL
ncbi:hypothetical protein HMI54_008448 [Coelomomyces lativittatus]|nr:hypothetical protein HMI56_002529 [Coelomomyces lativittatus]KAJ1503055.1 hypothetical protein HMI54_008448 [Coelomomyces lativittatus]KAJ1513805.1 hypothetical protein HMI55_005216 [Coelomomyces lativittatus]